MLARHLEALLRSEFQTASFGSRFADSISERFVALRGSGLLPRGRQKNAQNLSTKEIVAGILSLAAENPNYAGHAAKILSDLRPVGGVDASFHNSATFGSAIEGMLVNPDRIKSIVDVRISLNEINTNSHGRCVITYVEDNQLKTAYFVSHLAVSLLQKGAEATFTPTALVSSAIIEQVLFPRFFKRIHEEMQVAYPILTKDIWDIDEKEVKAEERARRLKISPGGHFLNVGANVAVTWPIREMVFQFENRNIVLMPKTKEQSASLHIDLRNEKINTEEALTLLNRLLSLMTWCDDQFAILEEGWSGNPIPVAVPKTNLAPSLTEHFWFSRHIPNPPEAKRALAIYREARNAHQNHMIPYAVLSYYKLVELKHKGRNEVKKWFGKSLTHLRQEPNLVESIERFDKEVKSSSSRNAEDYLWEACRCAVAHANKPYSIDADEYTVLRRLYVVADVLRALARLFIIKEFNVSTNPFSDT